VPGWPKCSSGPFFLGSGYAGVGKIAPHVTPITERSCGRIVVHFIEQPAFAEPPKGRQFDGHSLVIHRRPAESARRLILLVHGLRGHRYGYWGKTPDFLFEDFPNADVGLYFYRTAARHFGLNHSVNLNVEATVLAGELIQLNTYSEIVLIGHSMGGLLAKAVVYTLLTQQRFNHLRRVVGLVLMACPQLGSLRVSRIFQVVSRDARALYPHNELVRQIQAAFTAHLSLELDAGDDMRFTLPTWVGVAASDFWVDALSASVGIPWPQQQTLRGGHSEIVRTLSKETAAYKFLKEATTVAFTRHCAVRFGAELIVDDASTDDIAQIMDLARRWFPDDVPPDEDINPFCWHRQTIPRYSFHQERRADCYYGGESYLCVFYLSKRAAEQVQAGELTGATMRPEHLA